MKTIFDLLEKYKYQKRTKSFKMTLFIYQLLQEKKLTDLERVKSYCHTFYDTNKNTINKSINVLIINNMVKVKTSLRDGRKKDIFPV